MKEPKDIKDDQIRIIGAGEHRKPLWRRLWVGVVFLLAILSVAAIILFQKAKGGDAAADAASEAVYFEPVAEAVAVEQERVGSAVDSLARGFTEIRDTLVNDIPLRIYIPHNAELSLHVGRMSLRDTSVVYAAQAADVRADNGGIVGAFVLKGTPLSWGLSKKGFCASINGKITIGMADNTPLFEQATDQGGYFFRQYPLVHDGQVVDNEPKGKSIRRGICHRGGEIFMVETATPESFHDFSQALVDLGVGQAVYLVGSSAFGWAVDESGRRHEFGNSNEYKGRRPMPPNTSYIVWRRR